MNFLKNMAYVLDAVPDIWIKDAVVSANDVMIIEESLLEINEEILPREYPLFDILNI